MERTCFIKSHVDDAQLRYRGDKRRLEFPANLTNCRERNYKNLRQFNLMEVTSFEDKFTNTVPHHTGMFDAPIPNILISRQKRPTFRPNGWEPFVVGGAAVEMG